MKDNELEISRTTLELVPEGVALPQSIQDLDAHKVLQNVQVVAGEQYLQDNAQMLRANIPVDDIIKAGKEVIHFLSDNTAAEAKSSSFYVLYKDDLNGLNYRPSKTFRWPGKDAWFDYRATFWGTGIGLTERPVASMNFHFSITNNAQPTTEGIPKGFYIPNITIIPTKVWALPGRAISATLHITNPTADQDRNGNLVAQIGMIVEATVKRLGIQTNGKKWGFFVRANDNSVSEDF